MPEANELKGLPPLLPLPPLSTDLLYVLSPPTSSPFSSSHMALDEDKLPSRTPFMPNYVKALVGGKY